MLDPILYAEQQARETAREPISPTNGQSKVVVTMDYGRPNWWAAFPGLREVDTESECRS